MFNLFINLFQADDAKAKTKTSSRYDIVKIVTNPEQSSFRGAQECIKNAQIAYNAWYNAERSNKNSNSLGWWTHHSIVGQNRAERLRINVMQNATTIADIKGYLIEYFCEDSIFAKTRSSKHSYLAFLLEKLITKPKVTPMSRPVKKLFLGDIATQITGYYCR